MQHIIKLKTNLEINNVQNEILLQSCSLSLYNTQNEYDIAAASLCKRILFNLRSHNGKVCNATFLRLYKRNVANDK